MIDDSHFDAFFDSDMDAFLPISIVSGGFDPIHSGHISLLKGASALGRVVVILNSDDWLIRKKGKPFMSWDERATILRSIRYVSAVVPVDDSDGTVCAAVQELRDRFTYPNPVMSPPMYFCNGGDRTIANTPEQALCGKLDIGLAWHVGGFDKVQSSSHLLENWAS